MAALFVSECPRLLAALHAAVAARDAVAIDQAAHALKGSVSNFAAPTAAAVAERLELAGRVGDVAASAELLRALEAELERLLPTLREMIT